MNYFEKAILSTSEIFTILGSPLSDSQINFLKSDSVSKSISPPATYEEQMSLMPLKELPLPSIDQVLNSNNLENSFQPFNEVNALFTNIALKLLKAFFYCSQNGYHFIDPNAIANRFGKTIDVAYPGSSTEFISFAESFWTMKLMHDEIVLSHKDLNLTLLYGWLEFNIGSIFFPAGGGHSSISLEQRINAQRKIMSLVGYQKTDDFIHGNPMLRSTHANQSNVKKSGCLGVLAMFPIILFLILVII